MTWPGHHNIRGMPCLVRQDRCGESEARTVAPELLPCRHTAEVASAPVLMLDDDALVGLFHYASRPFRRRTDEIGLSGSIRSGGDIPGEARRISGSRWHPSRGSHACPLPSSRRRQPPKARLFLLRCGYDSPYARGDLVRRSIAAHRLDATRSWGNQMDFGLRPERVAVRSAKSANQGVTRGLVAREDSPRS
jgi:hypothetical protein